MADTHARVVDGGADAVTALVGAGAGLPVWRRRDRHAGAVADGCGLGRIALVDHRAVAGLSERGKLRADIGGRIAVGVARADLGLRARAANRDGRRADGREGAGQRQRAQQIVRADGSQSRVDLARLADRRHLGAHPTRVGRQPPTASARALPVVVAGAAVGDGPPLGTAGGNRQARLQKVGAAQGGDSVAALLEQRDGLSRVRRRERVIAVRQGVRRQSARPVNPASANAPGSQAWSRAQYFAT